MTTRGTASQGRIESKRALPPGPSSRATTVTSAALTAASSSSSGSNGTLTAAASMPAPKIKSLFDLVAEKKKADDEKGDDKGPREVSIFYLGPRQSGKSTLMLAYTPTGKDDNPVPTSALDYRSVRSHLGMDEKTLTHIWELGGGRALTSLADIALSPEMLKITMVVIVLDLSKPSRVISDLMFWINLLRSHCLKLRSSSPDTYVRMQADAQKRFGELHKDLAACDLLPVNVLIVGGKFDTFKDRESEPLRIMARTLRSIAHTNGAGLLYFSKKYQTLVQAFRNRIDRHVLNKAPSKTPPMIDHMKPLSIHPGSDSFESIGAAPSSSAGTPSAQGWINVFPKYFPPTADEKEEDSGPPELSLVAEQPVDAALTQKEEDLRRLQREKEAKRNAMRGAGAEFKDATTPATLRR